MVRKIASARQNTATARPKTTRRDGATGPTGGAEGKIRSASATRFTRGKTKGKIVKGPTRFVGDAGEHEVIILPRADYDALVERLEDLEATIAFARTRDEELVPAQVVDRLLAGEAPVRVWRRHRGLKLQDLATRIGRSKAYLSEIECGKKTGSVQVLRAIARTLDVDLDDLV